jgi:hypothetical protein
VRHGEEDRKDDAGEAELETEVGQSSGELVALRAVVLPALLFERLRRGLGQGGLKLEPPLVGLTVERLFV